MKIKLTTCIACEKLFVPHGGFRGDWCPYCGADQRSGESVRRVMERATREAEGRLFHGRRGFAQAALRGLFANAPPGMELDWPDKSVWAKVAFDWADAMLAEEKARYGDK